MTEEKNDVEQKYVQIVVEKGERTYRLVIPDGSPIGEAFDASMEISRILVGIAQKSVEEKPVEEKEEE